MKVLDGRNKEHWIIGTILAIALFFRIYRINELLGFWYDQGRDALVIWDLIHKGKLFLIGPMMANTGIFRGPWYYYLITPFYWIGGGDPVWPAVFLALTTVAAVFVIYRVGGWRSALIASVSMYVVGASRWLADPTPTLLVSAILIWAIYKFLDNKNWALPLIAFLIGMALNFSAATEVFYTPAFLVILYIKRKNLPNLKIILLSFGLFIFAFTPQIFFELRHPGVQTGAFYLFLFRQNSFTFSFWEIIKTRLPFYYNLFASKFWLNGGLLFAPFFAYFVFALVKGWKIFWKDDKFKILFIISIAPIVGTFFFTGTSGNIYEYYFTGYYLIWILLFSKVLNNKIVVTAFLIILCIKNFLSFNEQYIASSRDSNAFTYSNQLAVVDYVYNDSRGQNFNIDVYVPPVIPYSYQYLFLWRSMGNQVDTKVPLLYTLEEPDPDHPERISAWYKRQEGIARIEKTITFGGITVERRTRIK